MEREGFFMNDVSQVRRPRIVVVKREKALLLFDGGTPAARIRIALGRNAVGPKEREGDLRTPEGVYAVCVRNDQSKYHLALGLNYPNATDAQRGLSAGLINENQYEDILDKISRRLRPPWDTPLGGEIMIHGGGADRDWTAGCIALDNEGIDFLWRFAPIGTEVEIIP